MMALVATRLLSSKFISRQSLFQGSSLLSVQQERQRHKAVSRRRTKILPTRHMSCAKTFQQRLEEISAKDSHCSSPVNIGFPLVNPEEAEKRPKRKARGKQEFAARHRKLKLDLKAVCEAWTKEQGPHHVRGIAEHYGIYEDLFRSAFFHNTTPMSVCYEYDETFITPVCYGNRVPPSEAAMAPFVSYKSDPDALWTLVMTSPDGNLQHNDKECLHWMVTNIRGCDVHGGETLCGYLPPFPVRGCGYHRYVFVLFRQQRRLGLSDSCKILNSESLSQRSFSTGEFYSAHREDLTPASLCFFQCRWDSSVTSVFRNVLKIKEPSYEFVPPPYYYRLKQSQPRKPIGYWDLMRSMEESENEMDLYEEDVYVIATMEDGEEKLNIFVPTEGSRVSPPSMLPEAASPKVETLPASSWMKPRLKDLRLLPRHQWKELKCDGDDDDG